MVDKNFATYDGIDYYDYWKNSPEHERDYVCAGGPTSKRGMPVKDSNGKEYCSVERREKARVLGSKL